ncbi:hypothetical protein EBU71_02620 [bacterium]|nr:hypothetical protein [Candidatus Elulimicrobium humile]
MKHLILAIDQIDKIDFSQVVQTRENLKLSCNLELTYISWEGEDIPDFIPNLDQVSGPFSDNQMIEILNTHEWMVIAPTNI